MPALSNRAAAPTLESVAARAGVSRATAGRALSGSTSVKKSTRQAVELNWNSALSWNSGFLASLDGK